MDEKGLYEKYKIWKDGIPANGRFFVLKPVSDPAAVEALRAYAHATPNTALANDLWQWIREIEERAIRVRNMHYILVDRTPVKETDIIRWAEWYDSADRVVKQTTVADDVRISTVFLGINYQFGYGPPLLFETMIFGGECHGDTWRYSTWEEAEAGHDKVVEEVSQDFAEGTVTE